MRGFGLLHQRTRDRRVRLLFVDDALILRVPVLVDVVWVDPILAIDDDFHCLAPVFQPILRHFDVVLLDDGWELQVASEHLDRRFLLLWRR